MTSVLHHLDCKTPCSPNTNTSPDQSCSISPLIIPQVTFSQISGLNRACQVGKRLCARHTQPQIRGRGWLHILFSKVRLACCPIAASWVLSLNRKDVQVPDCGRTTACAPPSGKLDFIFVRTTCLDIFIPRASSDSPWLVSPWTRIHCSNLR